MKSKPLWFLLIVLCLSIEGFSQIRKISRGEPCLYDTCIAISLNNYRNIRQQFILRDSLINSLKLQVSLYGKQEVSYDSMMVSMSTQIASFNNSLSRKDSLILDLSRDIERMAEIKTTDPKRWFQRPATWISGAIGILIGVLVRN